MCTHTLSLSRSYYSFIKMFHNHNHDDVDAGSGSCHRTKQETEKSWKNEWGCLRPSLTFSCIFFRLPNEWFSNHQPFLQPLRADEVSEGPAPSLLGHLSSSYGICLFLFEGAPQGNPLGLKVCMADLLWVSPTEAKLVVLGRQWPFVLTLRNRVWLGELDLASVAFFNFLW